MESVEIVPQGFIRAFLQSFSLAFASDFGDRTFLIAAVLASRHRKGSVFAGAAFALSLVTIASGTIGYFAAIIPSWIICYLSALLFSIFGYKTLKEAYYMDPGECEEELEEVQNDLLQVEKKEKADKSQHKTRVNFLYKFLSRGFIQSFTMTFLAEWGDRSQVAAVCFAAKDNLVGVIIGGALGQILCTGIAVIGGGMLSKYIPLRAVTATCGLIFLVSALCILAYN